ncbi:MAG: hypothetical protein ACI835_000876 [Planctomycetota bacterium]|jgi:hypothetical protein
MTQLEPTGSTDSATLEARPELVCVAVFGPRTPMNPTAETPDFRSAPRDIAGWLAEARWLHSLALRLVRDRGAVDDLVQETCLAALQKPERASRAWLVGVMRNLVRLRARGGARRRARAEAREAAPAVPTPEALASRI